MTKLLSSNSGDSTEEETTSHNMAFRALLESYRERGLKLNKKKPRFKLSKVAHMGHILGVDSLQADSQQTLAIREIARSTDVQGVQRLIRAVTFF